MDSLDSPTLATSEGRREASRGHASWGARSILGRATKWRVCTRWAAQHGAASLGDQAAAPALLQTHSARTFRSLQDNSPIRPLESQTGPPFPSHSPGRHARKPLVSWHPGHNRPQPTDPPIRHHFPCHDIRTLPGPVMHPPTQQSIYEFPHVRQLLSTTQWLAKHSGEATAPSGAVTQGLPKLVAYPLLHLSFGIPVRVVRSANPCELVAHGPIGEQVRTLHRPGGH